MLKIEPGKFYRTRDGRKKGPILKGEQYPKGPWMWKTIEGDDEDYYDVDGLSYKGMNLSKNGGHSDLISEWQDEEPTGPVRTEMRKIIVPGLYGRIHVIRTVDASEPMVRFIVDDKTGTPSTFSASDLRESAKLFETLAEALEENASVQV